MWELDVALSSDGIPVVIHDDTLERTSNAVRVFPDKAPWQVHDFTLVELCRMDFGSWYIEKDPRGMIESGIVLYEDLKRYTGAMIPTLEEALRFTSERHWRVNVEIKDLSGKPGHNQVVEKVVALIGQLGMDDSVVISSFQHDYLRQVLQVNPRLYTAALVEELIPDPLDLLKQTGAQAFNPGMEFIPDLGIIQVLRQAGYDVFVWTVNEPEDMRRLVEAGATGLITDYPQMMRDLYPLPE
jgi:glycerophosphoryl diester phosphodiesterase